MAASRLLAGASGYSYKEWKGAFYPADIKPDAMLAWYSERLPTVEINNTFYRLPKAEVLENWAGATPPEFRFAIKASRRITHLARLKADTAADALTYLYGNLAALGPAVRRRHDQDELVREARRQTLLSRREAMTSHDPQVHFMRADGLLDHARVGDP